MGESKEELFIKMGEEIVRDEKKLTAFEIFYKDMIDNEECFTEIETKESQVALQLLKERLQEKKASLAEKLNIYENKIVGLKRRMEKRTELIEKHEALGAIAENDDIFSILVQTQQRMQADYDKASEGL